METLPVYSEITVPANLKLPLHKRNNYFCLLSGRKWSVLNEELAAEVKKICKEHKLNLMYLPDIFEQYSNEVLAYNFPGIQISCQMHHNMFVYKILGILQENLRDNESILIRYSSKVYRYNYFKFAADSEYEFCLNIRSYAEWITLENSKFACNDESFNRIMFFIESDSPEESQFERTLPKESPADRKFTTEQNKLIDIAIEAVAKLQLQGISLDIIKELITQKIELSRLTITEKGKIFLSDYNNKEVVMGPLPKTIFLFFLKHDWEFMFSDLMDYKKELLAIYEKISNRGDKETMIKSIETLTDPTKNSICEKCSAVRKAFLDQITYDVARNYFIEGAQGMPKKINLDRNLVEWRIKI